LRPLGVTQVDFADAIGVPIQRVNRIVKKKRGVTPNTALRFEAALGASAQFWLSAQTACDLWHQLHSPQAAELKKIKRVNAALRESGIIFAEVSSAGARIRGSTRDVSTRLTVAARLNGMYARSLRDNAGHDAVHTGDAQWRRDQPEC
jgi:addiction module HigA family antidote